MASDSHVVCGFSVDEHEPNSCMGSIKRHPLSSSVCAIAALAIALPFIIVSASGKVYLEETQQVVLHQRHRSKIVQNGPGFVTFNPWDTTADVRSGLVLDELSYVHITNSLNGAKHAVSGPGLFFPGAYDAVSAVMRKIVLSRGEFIKVLNTTTGAVRMVTGPTAWVPGPTEQIVTSTEGNVSYVRYGVQQALQLLKHQYVKLMDSATGHVRVEQGEQLLFPGVTETVMQSITDAINIDHNTAALVLSRETGQTRLVTERGRFYPGPHEEIVEERSLIRVEPHEVVIVQDNMGAYTFYKGNETHGTGVGTAFFLPPHSQLVTMNWKAEEAQDSTVSSSPAAKVAITKIDMRAQYSFFQYTVRTSDNVELYLKGNIFWQVVDVPRMIERTGDPKGDVWYHARSALIQAVSAVTLEQFMSSFNSLVTSAAAMDAGFYSQRGVHLHSLEVTSYACTDETQARVLQEIIRETTNRINRLQQQRSENEVARERLANELSLAVDRQNLVRAQADNDRVLALQRQQALNEVESAKLNATIKLEQARKSLVNAKADNDRVNATSTGEAQGKRLATGLVKFFEELNGTLADGTQVIELFKFFNTQEATTTQLGLTTKNLGSGSANLFLTPQDLNLRLDVPGASSSLSPASATAAAPSAAPA